MASNAETILRQIVADIEAAEKEKAELSDRITAYYHDLKVEGFVPKAVRKLIALRKMDPAARAELISLVSVYSKALGEADDLT